MQFLPVCSSLVFAVGPHVPARHSFSGALCDSYQDIPTLINVHTRKRAIAVGEGDLPLKQMLHCLPHPIPVLCEVLDSMNLKSGV